MHPLTPDLSKLTDDEIHKKREELASRMMFAYRQGNADMISQLQMLMSDYDFEVKQRNQKLLDDALKNNKNFKDKIDIK